MNYFCRLSLVLLTLVLTPLPAYCQTFQRTVAVHLFEWKWVDIAQECENFLGPKGFAAVQVSPPNEHRVLAGSPWYQRYQPVSYALESRSGTRAEFIDMVQRCKAVGVDVYVDAVINHMTGTTSTTLSERGSGGSLFSHYEYPGTYAPWDFRNCGRHGDNDIRNYGDRWEVRNCELVNLADLRTDTDYVRGRIAAYLNDLFEVGVAGIRIDAAKHMEPGDIQAILSRVSSSPYVFQEVIDQGGEPISAQEYFGNGDVTEFRYSLQLGRVFKRGQLAWLSQFGEAWGFMPSDKALVFVDNHDNQRGHGGGGDVVTFKDGKLYDLATIFMLAWPYGYPRVMSSYEFQTESQGPPADSSGVTDSIFRNGIPNCFNEWKCEHRWLPIANMVGFRNATASAFSATKWWSNGNNLIAFARGRLGYLVLNKESYRDRRWYDTNLSEGTYCDVTSGELTEDGTGCTGTAISVNRWGWAEIEVDPWSAVAIHHLQRVRD